MVAINANRVRALEAALDFADGVVVVHLGKNSILKRVNRAIAIGVVTTIRRGTVHTNAATDLQSKITNLFLREVVLAIKVHKASIVTDASAAIIDAGAHGSVPCLIVGFGAWLQSSTSSKVSGDRIVTSVEQDS